MIDIQLDEREVREAIERTDGRTGPMTVEKRIIADGRAVLYCGDMMTLLQDLPEVDAVITDPPYCSGGMYRADRCLTPADAKYLPANGFVKRAAFSGDNKDQRVFINWCVQWMRAAPIKIGGYMMSFIDWRQLPAITDAMQLAGIVWRGICPWDKGPAARAPHKGYARHQAEYIVWGTNGPCLQATHGGPFPGVYRHPVRPADKHHMAGKPVALMMELCAWVPRDALILDPFMGSGTTGVACLLTGRRFIGVEIDPAHFEVACKRIEAAWAKAQAGELLDVSA